MPKPTVIDALNDALGLNGDEPGTNADGSEASEEEPAEEEGEEEPAEEEGEEKPAEEEGEEESAEEEGEEEPAEEEPAEGGERNADGTFKSKPKEKDGQQQQQQAKKPDALNDPIPKDLKQETRERMQTLISTARELTTERDAVRTDFNTFVGGLQAARVSPEQYGETLSWLSLFNSGDPGQQEKALELVEGIADRLATMLGKERKVGDLLQGHADLLTAVQNKQITKEFAQEIARTRNQSGFNRQLAANATSQQQQLEQRSAALNTARSDLHTLEETLRQTDRDYERKKAILVPVLKPIMKDLPPFQWKAKFLEAYNQVKLGGGLSSGRRQGKTGGVPTNQPMRAGKQPAIGQGKKASSALDAMNGALANIGK
jgi:hypothetical protein